MRTSTSRMIRASFAIVSTLVIFTLSGCQFINDLFGSTGSSAGTPAYENWLYLADTNTGRIYTFDPVLHAVSSTSLLTIAPSAGTIKFHGGIGYVAVGYGSSAGLYWFDPSATAPQKTQLPGSSGLDAQYLAFASTTKAYVSVGDLFGGTGGLYTFDPSNRSAGISGPIAGTTVALQDVQIGADGKVYAADYTNHSILVIDPNAGNSVTHISISESGTTGICAGNYNGNSGVFVASNGGYDLNYASLPGSIRFLQYGQSSATQVIGTSSGISPSRVLQLSNGNLVATGTGHTWLITLSGANASVSEIKSGMTSFGSLDIAEKNGTIYVPTSNYASNASNVLYSFSENSPSSTCVGQSIMTGTDWLSNLAFYSN